ncbi:MAG TPA: hypothetical protein VMR33_04660 [Candidatus Baltobacteraceae bacterium]|jgi:hypothetical protein|nr:hypothetical protein [Candidatus Baltobacteraceae bacterium]
MAFDFQRARPLLQSGHLAKLFVEELGWEPCRQKLTLRTGEIDFSFTAVAEKRGFTAWLCGSADGSLPDHTTRLKLDRALTQTSFEHLIVFATGDFSQQSWTWVRREPGRPLSARKHDFNRAQPGDSLLQKLQILFVSLEEEEKGDLSTITMAGRARAAFDIERVTKAFYRDFDTHRKAFLKFIEGIGEVADREWYASVMLNRLMFVYFIQRKGFLDGDHDYLRNRLERCKKEQGKDKFYTFYRYFLLRLFHEGFGKRRRDRAPDLEKILGNIPYLNGGLFDVHELEQPDRYGKDIQIEDKAFERVFKYFDEYQWHLDDRPLKSDKEINPDVLGYIFEKYINQKQMGAYYTKEDITEYISKNTVLPILFDAARAKCKVAFENTSGPTIWDMLRENPNRYIYPAVRHGVNKKLPPEIAAGLDATKPDLIERRKGWNKPAPGDYALPTEIWREAIARRQRYEAVRDKLAKGEVREVNDFITLNLDLRQFAEDAIQYCEGPDLLMALWQPVTAITILDPTGGSGAFIFAALNVLEPLYEACLKRMEEFLSEWGENGSKTHPNYHRKFTEVLARVGAHPNRRYFVLKSIILNNLYAVDIMEEAVEICKLRLFLKLAAQVDPHPEKDNYGIEPLPDIDFNIRAGNTLVGYATKQEVQRCMKELGGGQMKLMGEDELGSFSRFNTRCADVEQAFSKFRQLQTEGDGSVPYADKQELQNRLRALEEELNRSLAADYGVKPEGRDEYAKWLKTHQPFHWFVQFYGIIANGGFDVIIGNPPYVELKELTGYATVGYKCEEAGNLYALVIERCETLGRKNGRQGFIVPVSSVSTDRYISLQQLLLHRENFFSSYDDRPSRLFDGLEHIRLTIHLLGKEASQHHHFSTRYNKWSTEERGALFAKLTFAASQPAIVERTIPKLCSPLEHSIIQRLAEQQRPLSSFYSRTSRHQIYYSRKVGYFLQVLDFEPRVLDGKGRRRPPSEFKELTFGEESQAKLALCLLNSSLFYWFITVFSDCRHVNKREVDAFPIDLESLSRGEAKKELQALAVELMADLKEHSVNRKMTFQHDTLTVQCIYPKASKPIADRIDRVLGQHYGFTGEELDFILNYDIKYRLGRGAEEEE